MAPRPQGSCSQCPRLLMGSSNLVILPNLHHSSVIGGHPTTIDWGNSDLPRVDRSNVVASVGHTEIKLAPIQLSLAEDCLTYPKRSTEELPRMDWSTLFIQKHPGVLNWQSWHLNQEDLYFLSKHIRKKKLKKLLVLGGTCSKGSVRGKNIILQVALMPFIIKFIFLLFKIGVSYVVMASAIATISKYHITDRDSSINVGRHTLVTTAQKIFLITKTSTP